MEGIDLSGVERFRYRTRYFTDSGIIGTKEFVCRVYQEFKGYFTSRHEKRPKPFKVWMAFFPSKGFQRILYEAGTTTRLSIIF